MVQAKLAYQSNLFFVAVHDGQIVGTVLGGYDGHRGWIYSLAVIPEFRGRGAGVALVQRAEQELQALGCVKINLQVRSDNEAVVEFYRRLGYSVEDRISMGKVVSS